MGSAMTNACLRGLPAHPLTIISGIMNLLGIA
jgi:hypothetical protein